MSYIGNTIRYVSLAASVNIDFAKNRHYVCIESFGSRYQNSYFHRYIHKTVYISIKITFGSRYQNSYFHRYVHSFVYISMKITVLTSGTKLSI